MAIRDLIENAKASAGFTSHDGDDEADIVVPDDLSGFDDIPPDPPPSRKTPPKSRPQSSGRGPTAAVKRQVRDTLMIGWELQGTMLLFRDPLCGNAILEHAEAVTDRMVPIICRYPSMLGWFTGDTAAWLDWLMLIKALSEPAKTVWAHHVTHSIGYEEVPAEAGDDYTVYAAPVYR